jgi:putative DNA primase/helicase
LHTANPESLIDANDRDLDNWLPLFAIADLIGGDWPKNAREAATKLTGEEREEPRNVELLKDIHLIFFGDPEVPDDAGCTVISSADLVATLNSKANRSWSDLTTNQIARILKPFKIRTNKTVRVVTT